MYFATKVALILCLSAIAVGEQCVPRIPPRYSCTFGPYDVFFPHPADCTYLIICLGVKDIAVSLCDQPEYKNMDDPHFTLGCPSDCSRLQGNCTGAHELPGSTNTPAVELPHPSSTTPEMVHTESTTSHTTEHYPTISKNPDTVHPETENPLGSSTHDSSQTVTPPKKNLLTCRRGGIVPHPYNCTKAFICPSTGAKAILFSICANVNRDSTFPVGCPEKCPNWVPGLVSTPIRTQAKLMSFGMEMDDDIVNKTRHLPWFSRHWIN